MRRQNTNRTVHTDELPYKVQTKREAQKSLSLARKVNSSRRFCGLVIGATDLTEIDLELLPSLCRFCDWLCLFFLSPVRHWRPSVWDSSRVVGRSITILRVDGKSWNSIGTKPYQSEKSHKNYEMALSQGVDISRAIHELLLVFVYLQ